MLSIIIPINELSTRPPKPIVPVVPGVCTSIHCFCFSADIPRFLAINSLISSARLFRRSMICERSSDIPLACQESRSAMDAMPSRKIRTQKRLARTGLIPLFSNQCESGTKSMAKSALIANGIKNSRAK